MIMQSVSERIKKISWHALSNWQECGSLFLLRPRWPLQSIVTSTSVCVTLTVRKDISGTTQVIFTKFFVHVAYGHGSSLLQRRCNKLCTSSFVDDIMFFFYNGLFFATKDRLCLNLLIYCNVGQNSISDY